MHIPPSLATRPARWRGIGGYTDTPLTCIKRPCKTDVGSTPILEPRDSGDIILHCLDMPTLSHLATELGAQSDTEARGGGRWVWKQGEEVGGEEEGKEGEDG